MNKLALGLSAIMLLAFVLMMAPGVLARNRGNILRNLAIWLAIAVVLGLAYQYFGPGKDQTLNQGTQASDPLLLGMPQPAGPAAPAKN